LLSDFLTLPFFLSLSLSLSFATDTERRRWRRGEERRREGGQNELPPGNNTARKRERVCVYVCARVCEGVGGVRANRDGIDRGTDEKEEGNTS